MVKMNSKRVLLLLLFLPFVLKAQDVLTLDEAIRMGLDNSFAIRIARNNTEIAKNNNTLGNAGFLPSATLNASHNSSFQNREFEFDNGSSSSDAGYQTHNLGLGAQLGWTVFDGFAMFVRKDMLETFEQQSELQLRLSVEQTIARIVYTYYGIAYNENLCKSFRDQMELSRERLSIAREKSAIGVGYELQELQSEVDYRADSARYLQQANYVINLKAELNRLLTRQPQELFQVNTAIPVPEFEHQESVYQKVQEQNTGLQVARLQSKISSLEIKEAKSQRYPSVSLTGAYNFSHVGTPQGQTINSQLHGPVLGVGASFTLFNGFNISRRIKNAVILAENQTIRQEELELDLHNQVFRLVNDLNQAIELVKVEERSLELAKRNADAAWERYRLGAISDIELRESQNKLLEAQTRLTSAQMNSQIAAVEIRTLTGDLATLME